MAKSYRKFTATAATAVLVASAIAPAASAAGFTDVPARYQDAVDFVVSKGVNGLTTTTFGTGDDIKRVDAAVMIAKVLGLSIDTAPPSGFTDVPERAAKYVNAIKAAGITSGKTATSFDSNSKITRGELAIWIQRGFELEGSGQLKFTDVSDRYETAVRALVSNKITNGVSETKFGVEQSAKRGDYAIFLHRAANATATPGVVEISSVEPTNAKTITVHFNEPLDPETLSTNDNLNLITLDRGEGAENPGQVSQQLSSDGKTLTFKAATFFKGDYTVRIPFETVKGTNGEYVSPANQIVTVNDVAGPDLVSADAMARATNETIKTVTLHFDEEVTSIDNVKINNANYTPSITGNTATFTVNLDASQPYEVTVVNAKDAAGNIKEVQTAPLRIGLDNTAPSISAVEATSENTVKVTLDEELEGNLPITGRVGSFTANIVTEVKVNPTNNREYFVTLNRDYLFRSGNTDTVTLTVAKDALEDRFGNTNASEVTKTVTVTRDTAAPAVARVETNSTNGDVTGFTVTYNKEVEDLDTSKISVVNSRGEILPFANVIQSATISDTNQNQVTFTLKSGVAADQYGFNFAEGVVTDRSLSPNQAGNYSFTVDVTDADTPVETNFKIEDATVSENVITVDFGTKVKGSGTGSAFNPAAYEINGAKLPADTDIEFSRTGGTLDQTTVNITLPAGFISANDEKAVFRVTGVQNLDNKVNNSFIALLPVTDNKAPEPASFTATELNELTVTYSEPIVALGTGADVTDELKLVNSNGASLPITGATVEAGKLVLNVADASTVSRLTTLEVASGSTADIKDAEDNVQSTGITINK
ncbi:S-layer homology domain-containing protein [Peribacillus saganii]|uniref:S-layer homology domain-containing protein n=1 Tax=Peribacillus saganii TaxID=2303992 RepID=A0A372LMA6_9BACI|nr:S-layer homology domain-containing protein [Peribacillus saganii]RFU68325.1 S-layer homology domain-containing protein [Peribacillus saganii]